MYRVQRIFFCLLLVLFLILPIYSFAQDGAADPGVHVSVAQNLFSVKPTLEIDDLEYYASKKTLFSGSMSAITFALLLVMSIGVTVILTRRLLPSQKDKKKHAAIVPSSFFMGALGVISALTFVLLIGSIGSSRVPDHLQLRAIPVSENQIFESGDRLRAIFEIKNTGESTVKDLLFRYPHTDQLRIDQESITFTKDGELPADPRALLTKTDMLIHLGDLNQGETAWVTVDFTLRTRSQKNIENIAIVSSPDFSDIKSEVAVIKRNHAE